MKEKLILKVSKVQVWTLSDNWLPEYGLLENFKANILSIGYVLDFDLFSHPGMDPKVRRRGMKACHTRYLWCKYECFLTSGCQNMDFLKLKRKNPIVGYVLDIDL